ncbi:MAG: glycosyltransferase [Alphaproteobacteria bacterium]|nr:glycosyltransferase [Alphaproteobacteria bacterium]
MNEEPITTVAICTRNRAALLDACLASVLTQTLAPQRYAVIVIDNVSEDDTEAVVARHRAADPRIIYEREPDIGVSPARNRALRLTRTPFIAFIDDDQRAQPNWLEELMAPFFHVRPRPAVVGGDNDPVWGVPRPDWLADWMLPWYGVCLNLPDAPRLITKDEFILEGNCAIDCAALRAVGMFPEALGRREGTLISGENTAFDLICAAGGPVWFQDTARTLHYIHPERLDPKWLRRRAFWEGVTKSRRQREFARKGLTREPQPIAVPTTPDHWHAILKAGSGSKGLARLMAHLEGIGFALDQIGLVDP